MAVRRGGARPRRQAGNRGDVPCRGQRRPRRRGDAQGQRVQGRAGEAHARPRVDGGVGMSDVARDSTSAAPSVGAPVNRVDGRLKVTGGARYAAEFAVPNVAHAVMITSTIAKGRVLRMDTSAAEKAPGVLAVLTPENAPKLPGAQPHPGGQGGQGGPTMRVPTVLQDDLVRYNVQPIGVVVADTFEHAIAAIGLVKVSYAEEKPDLDIATAPHAPSEATHPVGNSRRYSLKGDSAKGLADA